jgi:hypothetical protein
MYSFAAAYVYNTRAIERAERIDRARRAAHAVRDCDVTASRLDSANRTNLHGRVLVHASTTANNRPAVHSASTAATFYVSAPRRVSNVVTATPTAVA